MDNSNQPVSSSHGESSLKIIFSGIAVLAFLVVIGGTYFAFTKNKTSVRSSVVMPGEGEGSLPRFVFAGTQYERVNTFSTPENVDLVSESYEWAPKGESAEGWTSLITTHRMSSKDTTKLLSAELYAHSVASMNEQQGATIIETSVISTPEAIKEAGIDADNPPYLIVYAFPAEGDGPIEVDMQKVVNGPGGTVEAFIYAFPLSAKTEAEITSYFTSDDFARTRSEVIKAKLPY